MRTVICTDGSDLAIAAARRAELIIRPDADVVLVSVAPVDPYDTGAGGIEGPDISPEELENQVREAVVAAEAALTRTATELGVAGVEQQVVEGEPGPALCTFAEEQHADLVVVGSHGRGGLARTLLGSVSDHVIRHAPCPVLVVRSGTAD